MTQQLGAAVSAGGLGTLLAVVFGPGDWAWIGPLAVTLIGIGVWLYARKAVEGHAEANGTLYYVRHQFPGSADWHDEDLANRLEKKPMDFRAITRDVVQPVRRAHGFDVASDVNDLAIAYESQNNSDDTWTGFELAPDLLWFSALAFGAQLYGNWKHQTLLELPSGGPAVTAANPLSWPLRPPAQPSSTSKTWDLSIEHERYPDTNDAVVLVSVNLSTGNENASATSDPKCRPRDWRLAAWYGVGRFERSPAKFATACKDVALAGSTYDLPISGQLVDPWVATVLCVMAIRRAAYENPGKPILLSVAVPKTVAVAVGWHLMRDDIGEAAATSLGIPPLNDGKGGDPIYRDTHPASANLWFRLVPLYYGIGYHPVRVHRAQPELDIIIDRLSTCLEATPG